VSDKAEAMIVRAERLASIVPRKGSCRGSRYSPSGAIPVVFSRVSVFTDDAEQDTIPCTPHDLRTSTFGVPRIVAHENGQLIGIRKATKLDMRLGVAYCRDAYVVHLAEVRGKIATVKSNMFGMHRGHVVDLMFRGTPCLERDVVVGIFMNMGVLLTIEYSWRATFLAPGMRVPVELLSSADGVRDLLKQRSGPMTEAGRRKALLHWVRAHKRSAPSSPEEIARTMTDVAAHLRGQRHVEAWGYEVTIEPPSDLAERASLVAR